MSRRIEFPLAGELLKETGEIRVDVWAVHRESRHTILMLIKHEDKLYQDRFDGSEEDCDTLEQEAAGKDVWAVVKPDGDDTGKAPEIVSVEVVGND